MHSLDEIGLRYGTDKASNIHDYLRKYEKYFNFNVSDKIKILEIGVYHGASVKTWKEYFVNAKIIGLDISTNCKQYEEERITIEIGNQTDENFLRELKEKYGTFDLILDDGSHKNSDVIKTFEILFECLKSNGLYVVEDVCTSYWGSYGGGLRKDDSMIEYFKKLIDEVNFYGELLQNFNVPHARRDDLLIKEFESKNQNKIGFQIESINFMNSIILITKR